MDIVTKAEMRMFQEHFAHHGFEVLTIFPVFSIDSEVTVTCGVCHTTASILASRPVCPFCHAPLAPGSGPLSAVQAAPPRPRRGPQAGVMEAA